MAKVDFQRMNAPQPMQSPKRSALRFAGALAGTLAAAFLLSSCGKVEIPKAPPPPEVLVTPAVARDVPIYRDWVGTLEGSENAQIRSRVTGYVLKRDYQEGALVKKATVLFELDPRPIEAALAEAKGQLAQAEAVQLASKAEYERSRVLFAKKVISEKEFINRTQLNVSNLAKIDAAKANVELAQLNLKFCKVDSPIDGIVGIAQVQIGDLVNANTTVLTSVSTLNPIKIVFPIAEAEFLSASKQVQNALTVPFEKRPKSIELVFADGSVYPEKGRLLSVDLQAKASTGTILVTALLPNPGSVLRPGFFARARIVAKTLEDAVVVPQRAVSEIQGSYQIGVIRPDGTAEIRPVRMGARVGGDWIVESGVRAGESVVIEGLQKIKSGALVAAKPWKRPRRESLEAVGERPSP